MPSSWKVALIVAVAIALVWFGVACIRAIRKSRRLLAQYRNASASERALLEARAASENELGAYMLPLPLSQVVIAFISVAALVILAFLKVLN